MGKHKRITIITTCLDDWGGSEELWSKSLDFLDLNRVERINIIKNKINADHPEFQRIRKYPIRFNEFEPQLILPERLYTKMFDLFKRGASKIGLHVYQWNKMAERVTKLLKSDRPDLAIISQGINFDGLAFAYQCLQLNIPYILVAHKAVSFYWPSAGDRTYMRETLLKATHCFFVSKHNLNLTEEQFGIRLPNSSVILNPTKYRGSPLPFPPLSNGIKLACVGRLFIIDKGQDILLRILSQAKWKNRSLHVTFYGQGPDRDALVEMAKLLDIENVSFQEYSTNITDIWEKHHALILPSRSEGLPLTVIEAMSYGRVVITTNQGGSEEVIEDEVTGYISEAVEKDLDRVMEIAYNNVENWEKMGKLASAFIEKTIPKYPEKQFSGIINKILDEQ